MRGRDPKTSVPYHFCHKQILVVALNGTASLHVFGGNEGLMDGPISSIRRV